jgi:acyl-CoA thioesterase-1
MRSLGLVNRCFVVAAALAATLAMIAAPAAAAPVTVVALGDSLTAGTGLDSPATAFPARLEAALRDAGFDATVHNAGVAGDTSAGGLARLDWSIVDGTDLVLLELGANDALRGLDPAITYENLDAIVADLASRGIAVVLAGMLAPPNLGSEYSDAFRNAFVRVAQAHDVVFYPFFLDGVAADPVYLQQDGMHPNVAGVERIVELILPAVTAALRRLAAD